MPPGGRGSARRSGPTGSRGWPKSTSDPRAGEMLAPLRTDRSAPPIVPGPGSSGRWMTDGRLPAWRSTVRLRAWRPRHETLIAGRWCRGDRRPIRRRPQPGDRRDDRRGADRRRRGRRPRRRGRARRSTAAMAAHGRLRARRPAPPGRRAHLGAQGSHRTRPRPGAGQALPTRCARRGRDRRRDVARCGRDHQAARGRGPAELRPGSRRILTIRQPRGVYAVMSPWNFPATIPTEYLCAGLAAGNAIVWKPATIDAADRVPPGRAAWPTRACPRAPSTS